MHTKKNKEFKEFKEEKENESLDIGKIIRIILFIVLILALVLIFIKNKGGIKLTNSGDLNQGEVNIPNKIGKDNGLGVIVDQNGNKKDNNNDNKKNNTVSNEEKVITPRLVKISNKWTAGVNFFDKEQGAYRIKFYIADGKDGYKTRTDLYDKKTDKLKSEMFKENKTAGIYNDVEWVSENTIITTLSNRFSNKKTYINNGRKTASLNNNIETLSIADNGKVFYLFETNGISKGILFDPFTGKRTEVFNTMLSQWSSNWRGAKQVLLYPKPISSQKGVSYLLNVLTGTYRKENDALYGMQGLISPDASKVVYFGRKKKNGAQKMFIKDLNSKRIEEINLSTFSDKCVWSKNNINLYCAIPKIINSVGKTEPDLWYKGITKFEDKFIVINIKTGVVAELFDPETYGVSLDVIKPKLSNNDDYIYFIDKNTMYAWTYRINPIAK